MECKYYVNHVKCAESIVKELIGKGIKKFIIYPFGNNGKIVKSILNVYFGLQEYMIVDNLLSNKFNSVKSVNDLLNVDLTDTIVLITSDNENIYDEVREILYKFVPQDKCIDLFPRCAVINAPYYTYYEKETLNYQLAQLARRKTCEYILDNVPKHTKVFPNKYALLEHLMIDKVNDKLGLFLEFGVWKGASINFISALKPTYTFYGFDNFEGLPENWTETCGCGGYSVNGRIPEVRKNVHLIKGWFDDSLPQFLKEHKENCSFINIDCDLYSSTKTIFDLLKDRIVKGTIIIFDEYWGYHRWQENEYKAFQEFVKENNIKYQYVGYTDNYTGQQVAVIID